MKRILLWMLAVVAGLTVARAEEMYDTIRWTWEAEAGVKKWPLSVGLTQSDNGGSFWIDFGDGHRYEAGRDCRDTAFSVVYAQSGTYRVAIGTTSPEVRIRGVVLGWEGTNNRVTSLDVSGCMALEQLWCDDNQLTSLDVSGCTALTELRCDDNQLTSLDVSGCTALTELRCHNNQLTLLDVSGCAALQELWCFANQLTSLDVSRNTALTELSCFDNQLTSLDVSRNAALEDLSCGWNQLTSLDVSGCTSLVDLRCQSNRKLESLDVSQNVNLERLDCSYCALMSLDVSNCTFLTSLNCGQNQLTSLDVSRNTALTNLDCSDNGLTSLDVSRNTALAELDCSYNQLTSLDVSGCTSLEALICVNNELLFSAVADIVASLPKTAICLLNPQERIVWTVPFGNALPLPERPVIEGTPTHLDIWRDGELLSENGEYEIRGDSLYFGRMGHYKLVLWHDSVRERYTEYQEEGKVLLYRPYGDTTDVTVYSDYVAGCDVARGTGRPNNSSYSSGLALDFTGTAGETFIVDWGDGAKTVVEGTGEVMTCKHDYGKDKDVINYTLYGTTAEARITHLEYDASNMSVVALDVSGLPELTYLDCSNGGDLTALYVSKNPKLTYLDCAWNRIAALDVSKNPLLTHLNCEGTGLTDLDVSKNLELIYLCCGWNYIAVLDVSKNLKLDTLDCYWNNLTSLDVSNNVDLLKLSCSGNRLSTLDVSRNLKLCGLACGKNALRTLDISKNVDLMGLNCEGNVLAALDVTHNKALEVLVCGYNFLTVLDVSKNENLVELYCHTNKLQTLDVSKNVNLEGLYCRANQLIELDVMNNLNLKRLYCSYNRLEVLDISRNVNLETLECDNNRLLVLDVSENTALNDLECNNNRLTGLDLQDKAGWMECNGNFLEVRLDAVDGFDVATLPAVDVNRILAVEGGVLDGSYLKFESDEVRYKYSTGHRYSDRDTVWFCLVADRHAEPQIPLTAEYFPDEIFREYLVGFDKDGNDSLCKHEFLMVKELEIAGDEYVLEYSSSWSRGVKSLEGLQYFGNLEVLECWGNDLTFLDVSRNLKLKELRCGSNALTALDVSQNVDLTWLCCDGNALTVLDVSKNVNLAAMDANYNQLPLSEMAKIKMNIGKAYLGFGEDGFSFTPQTIPVELGINQVLDLQSEMIVKGVATAVDFGDLAASDYTFKDGRLTFLKAGRYQVRLTNDSVRDMYWEQVYDGNGSRYEMRYGSVVEVFYDITVKAGGGSDEPSDPSEPSDPGDDPDEPVTPPTDPDDPGVANEDLASAASAWAYVSGRTIYVTDAVDVRVDEVAVYTAVGQLVYRGHGRAVEVPQAGVYVLMAGERRMKVLVR